MRQTKTPNLLTSDEIRSMRQQVDASPRLSRPIQNEWDVRRIVATLEALQNECDSLRRVRQRLLAQLDAPSNKTLPSRTLHLTDTQEATYKRLGGANWLWHELDWWKLEIDDAEPEAPPSTA